MRFGSPMDAMSAKTDSSGSHCGMLTLDKYFSPKPHDCGAPALPLVGASDAASLLAEASGTVPNVEHPSKKHKVMFVEVDKLLDAELDKCRFCDTFLLSMDRSTHEVECGYMEKHAWSRLQAPIGVLNDGLHIDWFVGGLSGDMITKLKSVVECSGPIANMQTGNWWPRGCSVCILGKSHLHRGWHKGTKQMKREVAYEAFESSIGNQWLAHLAQPHLQRLLDDIAFPNCRLHRVPDYRHPMDTYCSNLMLL
jgi:hypothetical protein